MFKIALIEFSKSHEECIYTQVKFLTEANHSVDLIVHQSMNSQIASYASLCNELKFIVPVEKGFLKKLKQQFELLGILKKYDLLIFNTASSSKMVRNLSFLLLFFKVKCLGILHNGGKLNSSFTQKIISLKIKKYFVLSDTIPRNIKKNNCQIASFYPIFFPNHQTSIKKPSAEIWISVPGRIDWGRRDYLTLIKALKSIEKDSKIKFLLLGKLDKKTKDGLQLWDHIKQDKLEKYFIYFDNFISNEDYHNLIKASDYIMPLLIADENYLKYKISGSFNLAYAYRKTLICKVFFEPINDLKENAVFYEKDELAVVLKKIDKNEVEAIAHYQNTKWDFKFQQSKYLNFINEVI